MLNDFAHTSHLEWLQQELMKSEAQLLEAQQSVKYFSQMVELVQENTLYKKAASYSPAMNLPISVSEGGDSSESETLKPGRAATGQADISNRVPLSQIALPLLPFNSTDTPGIDESSNNGSAGLSRYSLAQNNTDFQTSPSLEVDPTCLKRSPKQMLFPQYAEMTCIEAVSSLLERDKEQVFTTEQIALEIYNTESKEELARVKACLRMELQRGEKEGKWKKIEKGQWQACSFDVLPPLSASTIAGDSQPRD